MDIDIKRLEWDAAYWDELGAPKDASHVLAYSDDVSWEKHQAGFMYIWNGNQWTKHAPVHCSVKNKISRPKPQSQEWDGEANSTPCLLDDSHPVRKIGDLGNQAHNLACELQNNDDICELLDKVSCQLWEIQKMARTIIQAEREREDLRRLLEENIRGLYCVDDGRVRADVEGQLDAILAKYELKERT